MPQYQATSVGRSSHDNHKTAESTMKRLTVLKRHGLWFSIIFPALIIAILYGFIFFMTRNTVEKRIEQDTALVLDSLAQSLKAPRNDEPFLQLQEGLNSRQGMASSVLTTNSTHAVNTTMRSWLVTTLPATVLLTIGCVLLVFWLTARVLIPLSQVAAAAQSAAEGDSRFELALSRNDEIGVIAECLQRYSDSLHQCKQRLLNNAEAAQRQEKLELQGLWESEQKYRMLFKYSGNAFALVLPDGRLDLVNRQFEKLSGYVKQELEGKAQFIDFFATEDRDQLQSYFDGGAAGLQSAQSIECAFIDRQGKKHDINLTLNLAWRSSYILASIADVTEFRDMQKRLNRSENLAAIGELAASIGHEIRNPLGAINTSVEVLQNSLQLADEDRELMEIISEETKRLDLIISDFLHFARLNKARFGKVNINRLISETLLLFKEKIGPDIQQQVELCESLPEIDADANQIKQVLVNMIVNALQAMPAGGRLTICSSVAKKTRGDFITITLRDSGEGISEENLSKIFQPFFSTKDWGVGMGLAICDRIMQNHGGEIAVTSEISKGTEFTLILPVHNSRVN